YILTPTSSGNTARRICRFKPACWVLAFTARPEAYGFLSFSYGVFPFLVKQKVRTQTPLLLRLLKRLHLARKGDTVIITERRLSERSGETDSLGIVTLD